MLELMAPWLALAEETLVRVLPPGLPTADLAYAIVVFYLGVNLMTTLDPQHERVDALFAHATELSPLLAPVLAALNGERTTARAPFRVER